MDFILTNLPIIICAIIGIVLLGVEMFMPGFGIPGISGIVLLGVSVALTWHDYGALAGLGVTVVVLALAGLALSISIKSASSGRLSRSSFVLQGFSGHEEGSKEKEVKEMFVGKTGVSLTVLRPSGIAEFDGVRLNVVSRGEFIPKDAVVKVTDVEGVRIVVEQQIAANSEC